jgi:hypothetical protein
MKYVPNERVKEAINAIEKYHDKSAGRLALAIASRTYAEGVRDGYSKATKDMRGV